MNAPPENQTAPGANRGSGMVVGVKSGKPTSTASLLLTQYRSARDALNASVDLLCWAIDIREQLQFGLDLEDMQAEVAAFNRACEAHKARRRRLAA